MKSITDFRITTNWHEVDNFHASPHSGLDLACVTGTKIYSQDSGTISLTIDQWLGNTVRLKLDDGRIIVYGHLSKINVTQGQRVGVNELLAETGGAVGSPNSGRTTAEHLHVSEYSFDGTTLIDPTNYLFHHELVAQSNSSPFLVPTMLILLFIIFFKFRKFFIYGFGICAILGIIFIAS